MSECLTIAGGKGKKSLALLEFEPSEQIYVALSTSSVRVECLFVSVCVCLLICLSNIVTRHKGTTC